MSTIKLKSNTITFDCEQIGQEFQELDSSKVKDSVIIKVTNHTHNIFEISTPPDTTFVKAKTRCLFDRSHNPIGFDKLYIKNLGNDESVTYREKKGSLDDAQQRLEFVIYHKE